jgi:hypothetical protein
MVVILFEKEKRHLKHKVKNLAHKVLSSINRGKKINGVRCPPPTLKNYASSL